MADDPIETLIDTKTQSPTDEVPDNTESLLDDENDLDNEPPLDGTVAYQSLSESDSEDEFKKITNFNAETAHDVLFNQLSYTKIFLDYDLQKELSLEVGVHVTSEHPWRTVKKDHLEEFLTDSTRETENLKAKLSLFDNGPDSVLLVGYHPSSPAPDEHAEDGVFIVYDEIESIVIATELIKKLEIWKRFSVKRALNKKSSRTLSSSTRISPKPRQRRPRITVEVQTSQDTVQSPVVLSFRTSSDSRDGYLELRPSRTDVFENVQRRRIDKAVQAAAQRTESVQQTDPTFPTNAHTQYSYEMQDEGGVKPGESPVIEAESVHESVQVETNEPGTENDDGDEGEDDTVPTTGDLIHGQLQKQIPQVSKQIKELLRTLEFNQIDLYRIEYKTIGQREIPRFRVPFLEEIVSFANIQKTADRHVSHIEWHPQRPGLFIVCYTWHTLSTCVSLETDGHVDVVNRMILQPNHILMWSFKDHLTPVLSFESPREVATVSFHPLDANVLIGGLVNGQVIIWDLSEVNLDANSDAHGDKDNSQSESCREDMRKFLHWTKHSFKRDFIKRSAISSLEHSQTDRITSIQWLNSNVYMNSQGEIKENQSQQNQQGHRYFVTSSIDGTVAFWNMVDGSIPEEKPDAGATGAAGEDGKMRKKTKQQQKQKQPTTILKRPPQTKYSHFDRRFRPQFVVVLQEPITSFGINAARFTYSALPGDLFQAKEIPYAMERELTAEDEEDGTGLNNLLVTTLTGDLISVKWKPLETDPSVAGNRQDKLILRPFPVLHDGPVVALAKNPLMPLLVLTIGQTVLSVWRSDLNHGAIYWQRRPVQLTDCKWSVTRPSVFFVTRVDGAVEIWDLLSSTQDPCLVETISGGCLTMVAQHRLPRPGGVDLLAVGDFNSNVRIFKLPKTFGQFSETEKRKFQEQIEKEVARKEKLRLWQEKWMEENGEFVRAKEKFEHEEKEREKERVPSPGKQILQGTVANDALSRSKKKQRAKAKEAKLQRTMVERSELRWEKMNMKRLMQIMMTIKDIDPKDCKQKELPIREQRAYRELKQAAVRREFARISTDFSEMRARILPVKEDVQDRRDVVKNLVRKTILAGSFDDHAFQRKVEAQLNLREQESGRVKLTLTDIKERGRHTREILNKSSGGDFTHKDMYEEYVKGRVSGGASLSTSQLKSQGTPSPEKNMFGDQSAN